MATRLIQQKAKNQHIHFSVSVREVFKTFDTSITQVEIKSDFFSYHITSIFSLISYELLHISANHM